MLQIRGENGAGKTSLLRILCGLSLPEAGEVRWNGAPILRSRPDYHRALAYLGHRAALNGALTPPENLATAAATLSAEPPALPPRAALGRLALEDCLDLPCGVLSAGQRQRVALAALLLRPGGLWILDEPATALDEAAIRLLEQLLGEQVAGGGMVVFTSHRELALAPPPQQLHLAQFQ